MRDNYSAMYVDTNSQTPPVGNLIFHNNFIGERMVYVPYPGANDWHHPVLLEGNFWSQYGGLDDGSGIGKHAIAGDGIGD